MTQYFFSIREIFSFSIRDSYYGNRGNSENFADIENIFFHVPVYSYQFLGTFNLLESIFGKYFLPTNSFTAFL